MRRALSLLALCAFAATACAASAAPLPTAPPPLAPAGTGQHVKFLSSRNEKLGAWLPQGEDLFEPWRRHHAMDTLLGRRDLFTIPPGATFFLHGDAGPLKVELVYDPVGRIALYDQGCCAWWETVLATTVKAPPGKVKTADLGAVRSRRGIRLGAAPGTVRRAYGAARLYPSTTSPGLRVLSYYHNQNVRGSSCGWFENFVFRANRLVIIQSGHGC